MARAKASWLGSRRLLAIVGAAMFLHAFISPRFADPWTRILRAPPELVMQPLQSLLGRLAGPIRRPAIVPTSDDPRVAQLQQELDIYKMYFQQKADEVNRWKKQVEELQKGLRVSADVPVVQIPGPVVGGGMDHSSSVLKVRVGRRVGISPYNTVAVVEGVQLVGRVVRSVAPFVDILPITDRRARTLRCVMMVDDLNRGPSCELLPDGHGLLSGPLEYVEGAAGPAPQPGMIIRLLDSEWPTPAQMLVVGKIERVETRPNQRAIITVRPTVAIDRVPEVVLRIVGDITDEPSASLPPSAAAPAPPPPPEDHKKGPLP